MQSRIYNYAIPGEPALSSGTPAQRSIKGRLLNISREKNEDFNLTLLRYVTERFLYRLGQSSYKDSFILKGAYLLTITLEDNQYRTTKDIDFLKVGTADAAYLKNALQEIIAISNPEDGIDFDEDSVVLIEIQEAQQYRGQRAKITAHIGNTRIVLQVDISIGDTVYPSTRSLSVPSILGQDEPTISAYPIETIIAEKLEAIISIGILTSRMKDFYDLYIIVTTQNCNPVTVRGAVQATFSRRQTPIPKEMPEVLTIATAENPIKQKQWKAFIRRIRSEQSSVSLGQILETIRQLAISVFELQ